MVVGAPLVHGTRRAQLRRGRPPRAGARGRAEVLPADLPRVLRAALVRPRRRPARRDDHGSLGQEVPLGPDLLFTATDVPGLVLHVEVCEDMWVPVPPSAEAALAGATVLANLSGSPITVARAEDRRLLVRSASARCLAAYVYAAAGQGESTTDLSWDGQTMVYECGDLLAESERFPDGPRRSVVDVDLDRIRQERLRQGTFDDNRRGTRDAGCALPHGRRSTLQPPTGDIGLRRKVDRFPFVPDDPERLALDCYEAYNIQVSGLEQRLHAIGQPEGGHRRQRRPRLHPRAASSRPGRWTGSAGPRERHPRVHDAGVRDRRDHEVATPPGWPSALGVTFEELDITAAARQMLADLDHPFADGEEVYDVTFENVQAGLRTDYLFRLANHRGGIVLGTGDLSELALGWCTYGVGDQMSHYGVNAGVPKTLVQHLIRWVADSGEFGPTPTRCSREILGAGDHPGAGPDPAGSQSTEDVGRAVRAAGLHAATTCSATATGRAGSRSSPGTPGATRRRGSGRRASRRASGRRTTWRPSGTGSWSSCSGSSPASSSARRCPTGPR